jgi:hypothetical protein
MMPCSDAGPGHEAHGERYCDHGDNQTGGEIAQHVQLDIALQ